MSAQVARMVRPAAVPAAEPMGTHWQVIYSTDRQTAYAGDWFALPLLRWSQRQAQEEARALVGTLSVHGRITATKIVRWRGGGVS